MPRATTAPKSTKNKRKKVEPVDLDLDRITLTPVRQINRMNTQPDTTINNPIFCPDYPKHPQPSSHNSNPLPPPSTQYTYPVPQQHPYTQYQPTFPLSQIIQSFRTFDGSTPAEQWLLKFDSDLRAHNLTDNWAWNNIDRVLRGPVKSWFASREVQFLSPLYPHETDKDRLDTIKQELKEIFGTETLRSQAKQKCAQITFDLKSDPQIYIMQKLESLAQINPHMSNDKKIRKIIDGLPSPLNTQLTLSIDPATTSPTQLLSRIRAYMEIKPKPNFLKSNHPIPNPYSQNPSPQPNTPHPQRYQQHSTFTNLANSTQQQNPRTPTPCTYCHKPYHTENECFSKRKDMGLEVPRCQYCGKDGHIAQKCKSRERDLSQERTNPTYRTQNPFNPSRFQNPGPYSQSGPNNRNKQSEN